MASEQFNQPSTENHPGAGNGPHAALPHQPGISPGAVDVTGIVTGEVRIDPDITEGHPGYYESGSSEIILPKGVGGGEPNE
jgi:hypothetical protein